jgi:hypothetical protein
MDVRIPGWTPEECDALRIPRYAINLVKKALWNPHQLYYFYKLRRDEYIYDGLYDYRDSCCKRRWWF